jgi:P4 family phage/plasmid primase-like protien
MTNYHEGRYTGGDNRAQKSYLSIQAIAQASLAHAEGLLHEWLPDSKRQGCEWVARNPTRSDAHLGSFKINLNTGAWADFATDESGGDLVSLYAYLNRLSQGQAALELAEQLGLADHPSRDEAKTKTQASADKTTWIPIIPVPIAAPPPPVIHYRHGQHSALWTYCNAQGAVLCHVARFDLKDGKQILPLTWCRNAETGQAAWRWQALPEPRPLYNLDRLAALPAAIVIVCEGEKAADACSQLFPEPRHITTTSLNGSQSPHKSDWSPLKSRTVWIWPDQDEPGYRYADTVTALLQGIAAEIKLLRFPGRHKTGWDAADALAEGWTPEHGLEIGDPRQPAELVQHREFRLTDTGNAERLAARFGRDLRYCYKWGTWLIWDGARWKVDEGGEVARMVKDTVRWIYAEAKAILDEEHRKAVAKHALKSEGAQQRANMLKLAQSEPDIPINSDQLDAQPWLFNCTNGTLDLRTGKLRGYLRKDYLTKRLDVAYDPRMPCPGWEAFLDRILASRRELIHFVQKAIGYSLTGNTQEQCFFILYGTGANGKSTLLDTLLALLGSYAKQAAPDVLLSKSIDRHPTELADLMGARLVTAIETGEGRRLAENLVKQMTGGDRIKARFMRQDFFEFSPTFKLFLATNHKPQIRGTDYAIWRRIRLIPFTVTIPEEERDPTLLEKLRTELPGILAWAVRGCLAWQREGLKPPAEVTHATEVYRAEMDVLAAFLIDCCVVHRNARVKASELYHIYTQWCEDNGEQTENQRSFGMRLSERGFERYRGGTKGEFMWRGIGLLIDT